MAYRFNIDRIIMKNGQVIIPKAVNIIIGPNSSGKSQFLRDIRNILRGQLYKYPSILIDSLEFELPNSVDDFVDSYIPQNKIYRDTNGQVFTKTYSGLSGEIYDQNFQISSLVNDPDAKVILGGEFDWKEQIRDQLRNKRDPYQKDHFLSRFGRLFMVHTGTREKLLVIEKSIRCGSHEHDTNLLSEYNVNPQRLDSLYSDVNHLFKKEIVLDRTGVEYGKDLVFRVFDRDLKIDKNNGEEIQGLPLLEDDGDGIKEYVAVFLATRVNNKDVIMIDEPETFLHPPLIPALSKMIADSVSTSNRQLYISTHSAKLAEELFRRLGAEKVNIIRLTRLTKQGESSIVDEGILRQLTEDRIMSSSSAIEGLFSSHVYIVEDENDKKFYSILRELGQNNEIDDAIFIPVYGKDSMYKLAKLFNEAKVDYTILADFDFISSSPDNRKSDSILKPFLDGCESLSQREKNNFLKKIEQQLKNIPGVNLKKGGIETVPTEIRPYVEKLIDVLKQCNIRILLTGELESSLVLKGVEYTNNKSNWLKNAINKLYQLKDSGEEISTLDVFKNMFSSED